MALTAESGPLVVTGQSIPLGIGAAPESYNADVGPSPVWGGVGLIDPRYPYTGAVGNGSAAAFLFPAGVNYAVVDQVPSLAATNNIAAAANVTSAMPMTLVSSTGAGVTVMTAAYANKATGKTVPACLALDGLPGFVAFGASSALQGFDPTKALARNVRITGVSGGSGGHFIVAGYDLYGNPQTEDINAGAGAGTTSGKKAFKFIASVTPGFTDAHNYSVGTGDVYGLPLRADVYGYVIASFNNAPVTSPTFVAADTTSPATTTTGDVRGTIGVTSDGTKRLQIMQGVSPGNLAALTTADLSGLYGVTPV